MKKYFLILVPVSFILMFISCGGKKTSNENNLSYKIEKYEMQSEGCDTLREDNCAKIKIEFPQITSFENADVKDKINKSIESLFSSNEEIGSGEVDIKSEMKSFIKDYEDFISEFPDSFQSWFIERTGEVRLNKGNIFSIDYMEYSYTGGAHPNTNVMFKNFNITDGEEITLDEIVPLDKQKELTAIAETEFRKLKVLTPDADLGQAGFWFENNEYYLSDNFLISDSSLVFYYNNYEITAYAFGPTELLIPYSSIKSLLGEKSLLNNLFE
jgi:hypothetical protein